MEPPYPVNKLRNVARAHADTAWSLLLDVDFDVSRRLFKRASAHVSKLTAGAGSAVRHALIVPAFETPLYRFSAPRSKVGGKGVGGGGSEWARTKVAERWDGKGCGDAPPRRETLRAGELRAHRLTLLSPPAERFPQARQVERRQGVSCGGVAARTQSNRL